MDVRLRPLEERDAATSVHWRNDPEIWLGTGSRPTREISLDDELEWIRRVIADESGQRFAIIANGEYVGNVYLTDIGDGSAEYHIFIGAKQYWGKGVARAASRALIEIAGRELGLARLRLSVRRDNSAALSLYRGLGFSEIADAEGVLHMQLELPRTSGPDCRV